MSKLIHIIFLVTLMLACQARIMQGAVVKNQREAVEKCPKSCAMRNSVWTGKAIRSRNGGIRYCECDTATQPIPEAFNVYNTPLPHQDANHPSQAEYVITYPKRSIPALADPVQFCSALCQKKHSVWMNGLLGIRRFGKLQHCACRYPLMDYMSHHKDLVIIGHIPTSIPSQQFCPSLCHSHKLKWNGQTTKVVSGNSLFKKCNCSANLGR